MKSRYIKLIDDNDIFYTDLIIFDRDVNIELVKMIVDNKIKELKNEYTNEDIYQALKILDIPFQIIFLGDVEEVIY